MISRISKQTLAHLALVLPIWCLAIALGVAIVAIECNLARSAAFTPYPDHSLTPGAPDTQVTLKQLCTPNYTKAVRNVSQKTKIAVMKEYGLNPADSSKYEIDHFISLENGGLNDITNLWPEPYCPVGNDPLKSGCWGARDKDKVESQLHRWICAKPPQLTLEQDQMILKTDWVKCYKTMKAGKVCQP